MIVVSLAKAAICFAGSCHPALIGAQTPSGDFRLIERRVLAEGYGGDVLQFKQEGNQVFAIHRVWEGAPAQRRAYRLQHGDPSQRMLTKGCINVSDEVYEELKNCCRFQIVHIIQ